MTTLDAIQYGIPRWMALSHLSEDLGQLVALAEIEYRTPAQRRAAIRYYAAELRRTQWERTPRRPARRPSLLRPSKRTSGYRTDTDAHRTERLSMSPKRRKAIAALGARPNRGDAGVTPASKSPAAMAGRIPSSGVLPSRAGLRGRRRNAMRAAISGYHKGQMVYPCVGVDD